MSYPVGDSESSEIVAVSTTQFDIKKFVFKLVRFLPWIALSILVSYLGVLVYLRYTPKLHRVSAHLLIKDDEESSPDYNVLRELGVMPGSKEVQNQIDILESYELVSGIVDSLNLQMKFILEGHISSSSFYGEKSPIYFHRIRSDSEQIIPAQYKVFLFNNKFSIVDKGKTDYHNYGDTFELSGMKIFLLRNDKVKIDSKGYILLVQDTHSVAVGLKAGIDVQKLHDMGGIVEISILDQDPERGIDIVNKLVEAYNTAGLVDKNTVGHKTSSFLKERVDTVSKELDNLEIQAEAFKRDNKIIDITSAGSEYLNQSMTYDAKQVEQMGEIKLLESLESYISNSKNFEDIIPSNYGLQEATLVKLIDQYNTAVEKLQSQSKISTDKDPTVARLKVSLAETRQNILKNIASIKTGYNTNLAQIQSKKGSFENLISGLPEKERELVKLKRQIGVKEQLYLYLLEKKEETELSLVSTINNTRVVDSAFDQGIVLPKSSQIKTVALLIGIIFPIALMLLLDFFNNKITDRKEIDSATKVPIIGELSYNKKMRNVVINSKSRSAIAEQFRLIRSNLQYIADDKKSKKILVTSFMSGEGKSFVSINLAAALATGGSKVLLIEMDLRKPKLKEYLDLKVTNGLTDFIINKTPLTQLIINIPLMPAVDIITSGPIPPNPSELMSHPQMEILLAYAEQNYDYVVIDSSPVGLVADAFTVGRKVDISLFILRHKYSYKTTLKYLEDLSNDKKLNRLNIIVNSIKATRGLGYAYGYGYGYSYGYGYGYHTGTSYYFEPNSKQV